MNDWIALLKPRVMTLVVFTGLVGLLVAPGHLSAALSFVAVLCIAVAAGAAGAINMWYDRDIDAVMRRTANRPIPAGRIASSAALAYGVALATLSVLVMAVVINWTAAGLLAISILFYVFIYTVWLKRRTPQNIVIGGAAGAFPPVIGWTAVTGSIEIETLVLFAIVFFWTPPHFWSLALYSYADYARAGVPMLPVVVGARETRRQILLYTLMLLPITLLPWAIGFAGFLYVISATLLGAGFFGCVWRVWRDQRDAEGSSYGSNAPARFAFRYSIIYLFLIFGALAVDILSSTLPDR